MRTNLAPIINTLIASTAYTTTTTSAKFSLPGRADTYMILINATTVTGTSPTLDCVVQTSVDKGTTYVNLPLRSAQLTAASQSMMVFKLGLGNNEVALETGAAPTGGTLAKNCIFDPEYMKIKFTVGGTNPSFTAVVYGAGILQKSAD